MEKEMNFETAREYKIKKIEKCENKGKMLRSLIDKACEAWLLPVLVAGACASDSLPKLLLYILLMVVCHLNTSFALHERYANLSKAEKLTFELKFDARKSYEDVKELIMDTENKLSNDFKETSIKGLVDLAASAILLLGSVKVGSLEHSALVQNIMVLAGTFELLNLNDRLVKMGYINSMFNDLEEKKELNELAQGERILKK